MNCMRCGVKTGEKEVFCSECLASMEKYPIRPGTPIHIPMRSAIPEAKKAPKKKRELTPEEQISRLRIKVQWLRAALLAALIVIALLSGILLASSLQEVTQAPSARNYTTTEGR